MRIDSTDAVNFGLDVDFAEISTPQSKNRENGAFADLFSDSQWQDQELGAVSTLDLESKTTLFKEAVEEGRFKKSFFGLFETTICSWDMMPFTSASRDVSAP